MRKYMVLYAGCPNGKYNSGVIGPINLLKAIGYLALFSLRGLTLSWLLSEEKYELKLALSTQQPTNTEI